MAKAKMKSVLKLRPTQHALGMKEVEHKVKKMKRMSKKSLVNYMKRHIVPVIVGPNKELYMIDNHHYVRACWEFGIEKVPVEVIADLSQNTTEDFWKTMQEFNWVWLIDGRGIYVEQHWLPENIKCMMDEPLRSLAWMAREEGGFKKTKTPYAEFIWAQHFRSRLSVHPRVDGYEKCLKQALKICRGKDAKELPGYIEK